MPFASLDHLIRPCQYIRWDHEADLLRGFQIDHQFKVYEVALGYQLSIEYLSGKVTAIQNRYEQTRSVRVQFNTTGEPCLVTKG
jgi:hypothetical protein